MKNSNSFYIHRVFTITGNYSAAEAISRMVIKEQLTQFSLGNFLAN